MYAHKLLLYLHLVHGTHISTYMHRSIYWNPFRVSMTISHQWREACASNVQKERLVDDKQQFDNKGEMIFFKYALHDTIRQLFCKKKMISMNSRPFKSKQRHNCEKQINSVNASPIKFKTVHQKENKTTHFILTCIWCVH